MNATLALYIHMKLQLKKTNCRKTYHEQMVLLKKTYTIFPNKNLSAWTQVCAPTSPRGTCAFRPPTGRRQCIWRRTGVEMWPKSGEARCLRLVWFPLVWNRFFSNRCATSKSFSFLFLARTSGFVLKCHHHTNFGLGCVNWSPKMLGSRIWWATALVSPSADGFSQQKWPSRGWKTGLFEQWCKIV